jgi:hypothetical protein
VHDSMYEKATVASFWRRKFYFRRKKVLLLVLRSLPMNFLWTNFPIWKVRPPRALWPCVPFGSGSFHLRCFTLHRPQLGFCLFFWGGGGEARMTDHPDLHFCQSAKQHIVNEKYDTFWKMNIIKLYINYSILNSEYLNNIFDPMCDKLIKGHWLYIFWGIFNDSLNKGTAINRD